MKKITLITLAIIHSIILYSQSKEETKEWIERMCNNYIYNYNYKFSKIVGFKDGYLMLNQKMYNSIYCQRIEISKIDQFKIVRTNSDDYFDGYYIMLFCKNRDKCIEEGELINNTFIPFIDNHINYLISIQLQGSFADDGKIKRMETAIKHLVKLYGGNAKIFKDTF